MNQNNENMEKICHVLSEQCPIIMDKLVNKLTGKKESITFSFEKFKIDMPDVHGPSGRQLGGGELSINGSITISAELRNNKGDINAT
jgi:hypothetical protein